MLSQMFRQLFAQSPLTVLPLVALGVFMAVFFLISARVLMRSSNSFDEAAKLPLTDGENDRER